MVHADIDMGQLFLRLSLLQLYCLLENDPVVAKIDRYGT